jgi:hypothetical protein
MPTENIDNSELKAIDFNTVEVSTSSPMIFRFYFLIAFLLFCYYNFQEIKLKKHIGYILSLIFSICLFIKSYSEKKNQINLIFPVMIIIFNVSTF